MIQSDTWIALDSSKAALQQQPSLHLSCTTALGLPNNNVRSGLKCLDDVHLKSDAAVIGLIGRRCLTFIHTEL